MLNALPEHLSSTALAQLENVGSITKFDLGKEWILHSSAKTRGLFAWPVMHDLVIAEFEITDKNGTIACQLEATNGRIVILKFKKRLPHMPAKVQFVKMRNDPTIVPNASEESSFDSWLRRNAVSIWPEQLKTLWELAQTENTTCKIHAQHDWAIVTVDAEDYCVVGHLADNKASVLLVKTGTAIFEEFVAEDDSIEPSSALAKILS